MSAKRGVDSKAGLNAADSSAAGDKAAKGNAADSSAADSNAADSSAADDLEGKAETLFRIAELETLIKRYQASYYNGEAEISDARFDSLWDELKRLFPGSPVLAKVGADGADDFPKARHLIPMGSQEKAANPEEFAAWAVKIAPQAYVVQHKMDGASLELQYLDGRLVRAITRGDGMVGDDITRNARRMQGVLPELDLGFTGGIRGEVVMPRTAWRDKYPNKANCRNAANGIMRRKDGSGCEDLHLVCYDAAASGRDDYFSDEVEKIGWLVQRGFSVTATEIFQTADEVDSYRARIILERETLPFDIDGLVIKDRSTDMADLRRARPERQIAYKFDLETAVSTLRRVEWSESGSTYTPIGIVDPVRLAGTSVQRANLNNPAMIRSLGLRIGSRVVVVKRGEIIPKIEGLAASRDYAAGESFDKGLPPQSQAESDILYPTVCGTCGTQLTDGGTRLYCPNPSCPKRIHHRLEKWISVLDIKEFGDKLLRRLYESGRVCSIADLYTLKAEELSGLDRMGDLSAAKVERFLRTPRSISLAAFVAGFDFDGIGETIMDKVVRAGWDSLESLRRASLEDLSAVYGLGGISAKTILDGLAETKDDMDAALAAGIVSIAAPRKAEELPLRGLSFCFTGELRSMKRSSAEERVKELGGQVKGSVVKDLSYLVNNDPSSNSGKNKKARELAVTIIDEDAFLALLEFGPRIEKKGGRGAGESSPGQGELF